MLRVWTRETDMTKAEKIRAILAYAFEGTNVSAENRQSTQTQFDALSDAEVDREYARLLRRQQRAA